MQKKTKEKVVQDFWRSVYIHADSVFLFDGESRGLSNQRNEISELFVLSCRAFYDFKVDILYI